MINALIPKTTSTDSDHSNVAALLTNNTISTLSFTRSVYKYHDINAETTNIKFSVHTGIVLLCSFTHGVSDNIDDS